jgi:PAS domain S-box-containing protein
VSEASRKGEEQLSQIEKKYRLLFESMTEGFLLIEMILDKSGNPISYRYLDANPALERLTHLKPQDIIGKDVHEVLPGIESYWIDAFGRVALTGESAHIEQFSKDLNGWYNVYIYCPEPGKAALIYTNVTDRKQVDEALHQERDRLAAVVRSIRDEVWFADAEGKFTLVNPSGSLEFKLDADGTTGVRQLAASLEVLRPDGTPRPIEEAPPLRALSGEVVTNQEELIRTPATGELRYRQVSAAPVRDGSGNIIGSVSVVRDITDRKRVEEALHEREERLEKAGEIAHVGSWELDLVNDRLTWSGEVYRIFGLESQKFDATYEAFLDAVHPDDRKAVDAAYSGSIRKGQDTYEIEHRVVRKSTGEIRYVHEKCEHIRDASGKVVRSIGMVQDITQRRQVEQALRESELKYRSLFDYMLDGFAYHTVQFNDQGKSIDYIFLEVNDAFENLTGLKRETVIGGRVTEVLPGIENDPADWIGIYGRVAQTGEPIKFENYSELLKRWYSISAYSPEKGYFAAVFEDITERKRAEEALLQRSFELQQLTETLEHQVQERTAELQQANEALRQLSFKLLTAQEDERRLIAAELHDTIAAELATIKFALEMAQEKGSDAQRQDTDRIVSLIQACSVNVRRIMGDLRPSMLDDLGLLHTLNWHCNEFQKTYSHIGVYCITKVNEEQIPDPLKIVIYRIIQEGLNNVAKHSKADTVTICLENLDGVLSLNIADNGQGFDLLEVPDGMGLSIMRGRTEQSQGIYLIDSVFGNGTKIHCTWPLSSYGKK